MIAAAVRETIFRLAVVVRERVHGVVAQTQASSAKGRTMFTTTRTVPPAIVLMGLPAARLGFLLAALVTLGVPPGVLAEGDTTDPEPSPEQPVSRIVMKQLPRSASTQPPSSRELVDARSVLRQRFGALLGRKSSAMAANAAAITLLDAAATESDRAVKWLLLVEARRLAAAAGNAEAISRSVALTSADWDFDAVNEEYRLLSGIPLRGLDRPRAAAVAQAAENLSIRAQADGQREAAASAQSLAMRAWDRAGNRDAARQAAVKLETIAPGVNGRQRTAGRP